MLESRLNIIGIIKVKILAIECYSGEKTKFKRFLTQIKLKIYYKGVKLSVVVD